MTIPSNLVIQLINKSKDYFNTFYMLLDKLQSSINQEGVPNSLAEAILHVSSKIEAPAAVKIETSKKESEEIKTQKESKITKKIEYKVSEKAPEEEKVRVRTKPNKKTKRFRFNAYTEYYNSKLENAKKEHPSFDLAELNRTLLNEWNVLSEKEKISWRMLNPKYAKRHKNQLVNDPVLRKIKKIEEVGASNEEEKKSGKLSILNETKPIESTTNAEEPLNEADAITHERAELKKRLLMMGKDNMPEQKLKMLPKPQPTNPISSLF